MKKNSVGDVIGNELHRNHAPQSDRILDRQKFRNGVKRQAVDDTCERPLKLIHSEMKGLKQFILDCTTYRHFTRTLLVYGIGGV